MTTQVVFRGDKKVIDAAMKRAKREGIPFDSVMSIAARAYAQHRFNIEGTQEEKFNAKTAREMSSILKDIERGKNIVSFKNMKEMDNYLLSR